MVEIGASNKIFFGKGSVTGERSTLQKYVVKRELEKSGFHGVIRKKNFTLEKLARNAAATTLRLERTQTKLKHAEKLVGIDSLTGLFNKEEFTKRLQQEMAETKRTKKPFTLLYLDLDHFKRVNDQYGHNVGSQLIQEIAKIYQNTIRPYDIIGRVGGDEFAIILKEEGNNSQIESIVQRIKNGFTEHRFSHPTFKDIHTSVGAITYGGESGISTETLLDRADDAMTNAKLQVGTALFIWKPDINRAKISNSRR